MQVRIFLEQVSRLLEGFDDCRVAITENIETDEALPCFFGEAASIIHRRERRETVPGKYANPVYGLEGSKCKSKKHLVTRMDLLESGLVVLLTVPWRRVDKACTTLCCDIVASF